jgi:hypothetical protein
MKKAPLFVASVVALTVVFYLGAYYFLPPPAPSVALVGLFAAVAMSVVWGAVAIYRSRASRKHVILVFLLLGLGAFLEGCERRPESAAPPHNQAPSESTPAAGAKEPPQSPAPNAPSRVTGTAVLLSSQKEQPGYGLYSYALLSHRPDESELPRYRAFLRALLGLPTAAQEELYTPKHQINITYIPLDSMSLNWTTLTVDQEVDYVLKHYDYGRGAVILASLSAKTGPGPVIVSVLHPVDPSQHPHPVLVQDLSLAQPDLMTSYVSYFVQQAGKDQFWQQSTMSALALSLRNTLETAAEGLSMSKSAVDGWVTFFK